MEVVEFFCGIGGVAEAARQLSSGSSDVDFRTVRAIDINRDCGEVYHHNFGLEADCRTIESADLDEIAETRNEHLWWLSPPCQPYCRRGNGLYGKDPRCDALLAIIAWFRTRPSCIPDHVVLENVPEFVESAHRDELCDALSSLGLNPVEVVTCPTEFGMPNRRRRYYLVASRNAIAPFEIPRDASPRFTIADILESEPKTSSELWISSEIESKYAGAFDVVAAEDARAVTACFASGYGKSMIRSGSYLRQRGRLRRFSPAEVARLMGFSEAFTFPPSYSNRQRWKMLGNSLSIPVIKAVLSAIRLGRCTC